MLLNSRPLKDWFGYTRRERRSSSILLAIIVVIIGIRYLLPEKNLDIEYFSVLTADSGRIKDNYETGSLAGNSLFAFDPNSATYDSLILLGFAPREANTILRYRNKGGKFRKPSDLRKFQGIDSAFAGELESYVVISEAGSVTDFSPLPVQQVELLDINRCDSMALVALPGIGPVLSARIIKYRNLLGGFTRVEQIKEVYGLPAETFGMIKGRLFADSSAVRKTSINSAGYREMLRIPYIDKYEVSAILKYRELSGRINSIEDLKENKILTLEKAEKVESYMDFR